VTTVHVTPSLGSHHFSNPGWSFFNSQADLADVGAITTYVRRGAVTGHMLGGVGWARALCSEPSWGGHGH
jgi:hypothetical protein